MRMTKITRIKVRQQLPKLSKNSFLSNIINITNIIFMSKTLTLPAAPAIVQESQDQDDLHIVEYLNQDYQEC